MRTFTLSALILLVAFTAQAVPVTGQPFATCAFGEPSMCDPSLPGLQDQLAPEIRSVEISAFEMSYRDNQWFVDLTLSAANRPGDILVEAWRAGSVYSETWTAGSTRLFRVPVGPLGAAPYGLAVEWQENGRTWHRWVGLHYSGPGTYHFSAGEGSLIPVRLKQ